MWPFVYKTVRDFRGSVILRNQPFKVSYSYSFGYDRWQEMQNFYWKNVRKLFRSYMGGERKHIKVCKRTKSQNWHISYFSPLCQLQLSISQNWPLQLVPWLECTTYSIKQPLLQVLRDMDENVVQECTDLIRKLPGILWTQRQHKAVTSCRYWQQWLEKKVPLHPEQPATDPDSTRTFYITHKIFSFVFIHK